MEPETISATVAARRLGDLLSRIRYRGESFLIRRGRAVVARGRSRNAYFNDAIALYNKLLARKRLQREFHAESELVREDSMLVLAAFEAVGDGLGE